MPFLTATSTFEFSPVVLPAPSAYCHLITRLSYYMLSCVSVLLIRCQVIIVTPWLTGGQSCRHWCPVQRQPVRCHVR